MTDFDGSVFRPSDSGYEAARCGAVWNALKPKRFPAVIVVARSQQDVVRAVKLARREGLGIAIRSGGHSWVGNAVRDGAMLLDLSHLTSIEVDRTTRTAAIEPGVKMNQLSAVLEDEGMFFPGGHCPTVGLAGFVLGGGFGINSAQLGPAAYSLRAVDVVTADGEALHVTDETHPDLMWAARGAGPGFFAVVTRMYVDLLPRLPVIAVTMQTHSFAHFDDLIAWYASSWRLVADSGATVLLIAYRTPPPAPDETVLIVVSYACAESFDEAAALLEPLLSAPHLDAAIAHIPPQQASISELHALFDQMYPEGQRYLSDNVYLVGDDPAEQWEATRDVFASLPSPRCSAWLIPNTEVRQHANAAFKVFEGLSFQVYAVYGDDADDASMLAWHSGAMDKIDRFSLGAGYVGDSNLFVHPVAVLHPDDADRLERLRDRYDPERRFVSYPRPLPRARM